MTETGKVTKIEGEIITLRCKPGLACHGCSSAICSAGGREVRARNPRRIPLKAGDEAEISLSASSGFLSALKVFGIPVLSFVVFYGVAGVFSGWKESLCVLAGLSGLILAALVLFFAGRRNPALPEVLRAEQLK
ncbi:MAG: SoxR reducing system RseC family protein [Spirochaetia bacterium]|jgi:positive regulator of sigma E activity|nr:SoxR reducing system RseC family protein [Spirochaetia bacterium]